ncbi:MAG: ferrous iron transport protein A, partial [Methanobacterium sp.]|nr:ferrous iron transport protein A [Methanobacterium sp.]
KHLMEMGFVKGAEVKVGRVAPLGDPVEIKIKGYSISLRKEEAQNIEIEIL